MTELDDRIGTLEERFKKFRIQADPSIIIAGDIFHGYAVNAPECSQAAATVTGACCVGTDCFTTTESGCNSLGGIYLGNNTSCFPNPCGGGTPTGACCFDDGTCSVETEGACNDDGGTYQGDGTVCDPNPCELPPCNGCGFDAFDGSGRKFLTRVTVLHYVQTSICCFPISGCFQCAVDGTITTTESYDADCNYTSDTEPPSPLFPTTSDCAEVCNGGFIDITLAPGCDVLTPISATEASCIYGTTVNCFTCANDPVGSDTTLTVTQTLSDECAP